MTADASNALNAADDKQRHELLVSGELDLLTAPAIKDAGGQALADPAVRTLAVDLRGVTFIDSTGVGVLVRLRVAADERDKHLVLIAPSEPVTRLLKITSLTAAFAVDQGDTTSA